VDSYYLSILGISVANLVLAAIAYAQRAKQIRGNALREQQVALAEARNELAERRLHCLDDQLEILSQIRDVLCPDPEEPGATVIEAHRQPPAGHSTTRQLRSMAPSTSEPPAAA
jgi:hypothetical protein